MEIGQVKYSYKAPGKVLRDINSTRMNMSSKAAARVGWGRTENDAKGKERVAHRHPVAETCPDKVRVFSSEGIRWDTANIMLMVLLGVLVFIVLLTAGNMVASGSRVDNLQTEYDRVISSNREMEETLNMRTDYSSIGYQAVSMGLISSEGEKAIRLTAPEDAMMTMSALGMAGL